MELGRILEDVIHIVKFLYNVFTVSVEEKKTTGQAVTDKT